MPKFFVDPIQISNGIVTIKGEDAHHISRSLRMAAGEHVTVSDKNEYEYDCVLEKFEESFVIARIISSYKSDVEMPVRVHLYQALPKGEKLDFIIQKAVECGVYDITPFESERCIAKVKYDAEERKTERRNKISLEAAKQSGRGLIPKVKTTVSFDKMLKDASASDIVLFCYEGENTRKMGSVLAEIRNEREVHDISIIIGSEGGFSAKEATIAFEHGFSMVGLGKRILRAETAAVFALSSLVYEFELKD